MYKNSQSYIKHVTFSEQLAWDETVTCVKQPAMIDRIRMYLHMDLMEYNESMSLNDAEGGVYMKAVKGDITKITDIEAIVNAANTSLLGGGGVDGAIHRAAGPELLEECRSLHGCKTGEAKLTKGYKLPCEYVIHTVGPIWRGGGAGEAEKLASCYTNSLKTATEHGIRTVAFPSISTGVYGYPVEEAAKVAVSTVRRFLEEHPGQIDLVEWVLFDDRTFSVYQKEIDAEPTI